MRKLLLVTTILLIVHKAMGLDLITVEIVGRKDVPVKLQRIIADTNLGSFGFIPNQPATITYPSASWHIEQDLGTDAEIYAYVKKNYCRFAVQGSSLKSDVLTVQNGAFEVSFPEVFYTVETPSGLEHRTLSCY